MHRSRQWLLAVCLLLALTPGAAAADNTTAAPVGMQETFSVTEHRVTTAAGTLAYTATAGQLVLTEEKNNQTARVFFIAYEKKAEKKDARRAERPVTFAFNGGPGSSSIWLHFGAMGPRRVVLGEQGAALPPPSRLSDNPHTWLTFTDLVFIDPVGTGYSRAADVETEKQFYSVTRDIESVGDFIRLYLTRYKRWGSPKFVAGESYGTTRAAGLGRYLHYRHGIEINGLVLISPVLNFTTITFDQANILPYVLFLPTYAATAWYHRRSDPPQKELGLALQEAEEWALQHYSAALLQGAGLVEGRRAETAAALAAIAGLPESYVVHNRLTVPPERFRKELLREEGAVVGRMDARFYAPDPDSAADAARRDPALETLTGAFAGAANHYIRSELAFESDLTYEYLNAHIGRQWDWSSAVRGGQGYVDVSESLTRVMHANRHAKVFIACGYYDLATPYYAAVYTINQLDVDAALRSNITFGFYSSGHMMYIDRQALQQLTADIGSFYRAALGETSSAP
jgi:carboxypeptidase C (cathepsin A)